MQGFNMGRYVPPDQEGVTSGNRLLGIRAQKANADGVPIVRFEMPFAIWCDGCEKRTIGRDGKNHPVLIGQGVRFNAEKHRTGNYYTTPIFTFRMRHPACSTWLAIRTDPATTSYVVVEGGRKRREYDDNDEEDAGEDKGATGTAGGDEVARLNAFDRLERTIAHRAVDNSALGESAHRINSLTRYSARQWDDPYARNRALRAAFRTGRHAREKDAADDEGLRKRLGGLSEDLTLLPASEMDARYAALVDFGSRGGGLGLGEEEEGEGQGTPRGIVDRRALATPLFERNGSLSKSASLPILPTSSTFPSSPSSIVSPRNNKYAPATEAARRQRSVRDHLASTVLVNTRMKTDPFLLTPDRKAGLAATGSAKNNRVLPIKGSKRSATVAADMGCAETTVEADKPPIPASFHSAKRKRNGGDDEEEDATASQKPRNTALVSYDSD